MPRWSPAAGKGRCRRSPATVPTSVSCGINEVGSSVFLPATLFMTSGLWSFLAVADCLHLLRDEAAQARRFAQGLGSLLAEGEVVFAAAALVGIAFESDAGGRIARE